MRHNANPTLRGRRSGILRVIVTPLRQLAVVAAALAATALGACGESDGAGTEGGDAARTATAPTAASAAPKPTAAARLARAPAALRANAADADTIAGEGAAALKARLAKLAGHPVVVNQWASWCGPCRVEFPYFSDAVVAHGDAVAFLGIDFTDDRDAANSFLRERPPGFASIYDPKGEAARSLGGGRIAPTTFFIGRDGKLAYTKLGGYPSAAALEADIRRHAL
ncbi:MAG: cytochrome c biosis protein CcmG, thiol:disulfide interchange protein DsbE [Solirubrobacteraceae bacterium]|nr:cytochrome c biosis protein CcmG, thiol:disulfide interchange protein DsbE [Solirubrobacteraceae bacterium]